MKFKLTLGNFAEQKRWPEAVALDWEELVNVFADHEEKIRKDGRCFVAASMLLNPKTQTIQRTASAVEEVSCLVYDIDGHGTYEDIRKKIEDSGYAAVLWTTYTHKTTSTSIKTDAYAAWAGSKQRNEPRTPTLASISRFLKFCNKDHLTSIKFDPAKDYIQKGDGTFWIVHHAPLDKVRIVFPLATPIRMVELDMLAQKQKEIYKSIYCGVGDSLGLGYDISCSDPSRLHYFPAHSPGSPYEFEVFGGKLMEWQEMPRAVLDSNKTSSSTNVKDWDVTDRDGVCFNLMKWISTNATTFDIETIARECIPEDEKLRDLPNDRRGLHVKCPFEHEHSDTGGYGTFVESGDGDHSFKFHCLHNSCKNAERTRLDFLKKWIEDGYVTAKDLNLNVPIKHKKETIADAFRKMGGDPSTLPIEFDDEEKPDEYTDVDELPIHEPLPPPPEPNNKDAIRDDALKAIENTPFSYRASSALETLVKYEVPVTEDDLVFSLAKSGVNMKAVHRLVNTYVVPLFKTFELEEFMGLIKDRRLQLKPLADAMNTLIVDCRAGTELERFQEKAAEYYGLSKSQIAKEYRYQKKIVQSQNEIDETLAGKERAFINRWAMLTIKSQLYFIDMISTQKKGEPVILSKEALKTQLQPNKVTAPGKDGKKKRMSIFEYCIDNSPDMRSFTEMTFDPNPDTGPVTSTNAYNTWFGIRTRPVEGDASPIQDHIRNVWCGEADEHTYWWVTTFLAHIFQVPWEKGGSGIVLTGPPGTGKSIVFEKGLGKIVEPYYGVSSRPEDICGQFTAYSCNKLIFLSEEAVWSGDKRLMRQLRHRVTGDTTMWEEKMLAKCSIKDCCRFFFTTNDAHAFEMDTEDRRYCILETSRVAQNDMKYFSKLADWLDDKGREKWLHYLLNFRPEDRGLDWISLKTPPFTMARQRQIEMSRSAASEFFIDIIQNGKLTTLPRDVDTEVQISWPLDKECSVKRDEFKRTFDAYLRHFAGSSARYERKEFATLFNRYIGGELESFVKRRETSQGKHSRMIVFPPRLEVLKALAAKPRPEFTKEDVQRAVDNPTSHMIYED